MKTRTLGRSDFSVTPIVLGTMAYGDARHDEAFRVATLQASLDAGVTTIDTAPLYGFGGSETMVGRAIAGRRSQVQLLSKVGLRWDDTHGDVLFSFDDGGRTVTVRKDSRPASIRRDVEASLQRLGVEHIDLCQIHHPDPHTPIAEAMGALLDLRAEGKIAHIGVSNFSVAEVETARAALGGVPLCSHQLELNPLRRRAERDLLPQAKRLDVGVLAFAPLFHGLLAGRGLGRRRLGLDDDRRWDPAFHPANAERVADAVRRGVLPAAARHDATVAEIVLAWVLARSGVTAVIVGASSPQQARRNARAAALRLSPDALDRITRAFEAAVIDPEVRPCLGDRLDALGRRMWTRVLRSLASGPRRDTH